MIFGPHAADFLSKEMLLRVQAEARKRGCRLHLHVAQDPRENNATQQRFGLRAIPYLESIGLLAPDLIAVHLSTATEAEVETVVKAGAGMVCCANSIGIIDGVMPPAALFKRLGGRVALGSDQAPGNNSHNIFSEMRATAMYPKIRAEHPLAIPSWQVLRSATIEGAEVLGVADRVGSLEVGKEADLIFLDLTRPPLAPVLLRPARNLVANLVYAETGTERDAVHGRRASDLRQWPLRQRGRRGRAARRAGRRRSAAARHRRRRAHARPPHRGPHAPGPGVAADPISHRPLPGV